MFYIYRFTAIVVGVQISLSIGCAQPLTPQRDATIPPPPIIYLRTPNGLVPMTPEDSARHSVKASREDAGYDDRVANDVRPYPGRQFGAARDVPPPLFFPDSSQSISPASPIQPQYYYVRPQHTSTGYIEGRYGRIDDFTPGEHTSTGYSSGHYRGDGLYTQPEHTATGYVPGHYRAEPLPNASSMIGVQPSTAAPPYRAK